MKRIIHMLLLMLCVMLTSCSKAPLEVQDIDTTGIPTQEISNTIDEDQELPIDIDSGYFIQKVDKTLNTADSQFYIWHQERPNLRSAFLVSNDFEIINEREEHLLYFMRNEQTTSKLGLDINAGTVFRLDDNVSYETYLEVIDLFNVALEAYSWFDLMPLSGNDLDPDSGYLKVDKVEFESYDAFIGYLKVYFSDEIIESLLSRDLYRNIDNQLYVAPSLGRGSNAFVSKWHYGLEQVNDVQLILTLYLEMMSETFYQSHDGYYPFSDPVDIDRIVIKTCQLRKIDGHWNFVTFEYPL